MATATLDELIQQTRLKANVLRSNFVTDAEIITYLTEARRQLREQIITADDSYYQATLDFSIGDWPNNVQALPATFWKMRGLDAFAGDSTRQREVFAREFRNRFDPGIGYYFGGDGNSIVVCGFQPAQGNPFRLNYVPKPLPFAAQLAGNTRSITHNGADGTNGGSNFIFINGAFSAGDVGATLTVSGSGVAIDGVFTILTVVSATQVSTYPAPTPSLTAGAGTIATVADSSGATRTFNITGADTYNSGFWSFANGNFGVSDLNSYMTVAQTAPASPALSGTYQIIAINPGNVQTTPAPAGSIVAAFAGTVTISRQPPNTDHALDLTEDNFAEYFSVRAGMVIARKKRQDTLVAALAAERAAIEERIAALSRMRQSEPQQAPVLWGRRGRQVDDWDV